MQGHVGKALEGAAAARLQAAQGAAAVQAVYADVQFPKAWWASAVQVFSQAVEIGGPESTKKLGTAMVVCRLFRP